jgi:glycosyltransferase involved in cell wall biosynthesis
MHIIYLTSEYPQPNIPHGGVGTFVQTIARKLVRSGIDVSVVGINHNENYEEYVEEGVWIYRLVPHKLIGIKGILNYLAINRKIAEIHQNKTVTIVEGSEMSFAFIKKIPSIKYIIRLHGGHHFFAESENRGVNWWKAFQEKRSFGNADKIIGVSQYVIDHTSKYIDFEAKKAGVIFNPANLSRFYEADTTKIVNGRIFFAGTICEKKGIRQLILAMPQIKKSFPEAHLVIAGREWFYPKTKKSYTDFLKTFITEDIRDSIQFLGSIENSQIPIEIEKAEICCYPSHMEAMPLAWIEVMSMGKTFVTSNLGPGKELIQEEITGLLCNPLSPEEIANKIEYAFENKEKAQIIANNGRKYALENFALEKIIRQNIDFYNNI